MYVVLWCRVLCMCCRAAEGRMVHIPTFNDWTSCPCSRILYLCSCHSGPSLPVIFQLSKYLFQFQLSYKLRFQFQFWSYCSHNLSLNFCYSSYDNFNFNFSYGKHVDIILFAYIIVLSWVEMLQVFKFSTWVLDVVFARVLLPLLWTKSWSQ